MIWQQFIHHTIVGSKHLILQGVFSPDLRAAQPIFVQKRHRMFKSERPPASGRYPVSKRAESAVLLFAICRQLPTMRAEWNYPKRSEHLPSWVPGQVRVPRCSGPHTQVFVCDVDTGVATAV
jgi:hypothetical protein